MANPTSAKSTTATEMALATKSHAALTASAKKAPSRADDEGEVVCTAITEIPEGTTKTYTKQSGGLYSLWWYYIFEYDEESVGEITFCDNGEVYFKNIISNAAFDVYIKGQLNESGDKITVSLPQDNSEDFGDGYWCQLVCMTGYTYDAEMCEATATFAEAEDNYLVYGLADDGTVTLEKGMPGLIWSDDLTFTGYCDKYQIYTPFEETAVTIPEGVATEQWVMYYTDQNGETGHMVSVGIDGSDIYIGGLSTDMPDGWVKGEIAGDKVTIKTGQYMGLYYTYFIHFVTGCINPNYDENDEESTEPYYILTGNDFVFNYDAANKSLTPADPDVYMFVNASLDRVYYLAMIVNPTIKYQEFGPATPKDPEIVDWRDYTDYDLLIAYMPIFDTNGNLLDVDSYYYNLYVDGDIYEFDTWGYIYLEEVSGEQFVTDMPYTYSDYYDIYMSDGNNYIYLNFSDYDTVGLQTFYVKDGVTNYSNRVTYDVNTGESWVEGQGTSSIDAVSASKEVKSATYYDLSGRRVANPETGLYIQRTVYTDGTVKTVKRLVK